MAEKRRELLNGSITKNLIKMSLPTMIGFMFQSLYDIVDMIWVGRISSSAVAGVTIFSTIFWLTEVLNEIIGTSSISLISQSFGTGDDEKTSLSIEQTLTFKALVAVIAAVIMLIILKPLLRFFTQDQTALNSALSYGYIRIFFLPVMFSSYTINTAFRCIGDAKKPMIIMVIATIINVVLDPLFMFKRIPGTNIAGFNMGVFGAGLATVISVTISFVLAFLIFMYGQNKAKIRLKMLLKLDRKIDKKLLTIGLPSGFQVLSRNLSGILTLKFVSIYGTAAVAAIGIGQKILNFSFMPLVGFSMGASAIVGQCLGAQNIERAKCTVKKAAFLGAFVMLFVSAAAIIFPKGILSAFISDCSVIKIGMPMIRIIAPGLIISGITMGLGACFSGSGYNMPYFISSIISRWCVQIPLLFIIVYILKKPIIWVWVSFIAADAAEMIATFFFYKKANWQKKRVA